MDWPYLDFGEAVAAVGGASRQDAAGKKLTEAGSWKH